MKVCLIRPPRFLDLESVSMPPSPPLGLAFIAGALKNAGHEVVVVDAIGDKPVQYLPLPFKLDVGVNYKLPAGNVLVSNGLSLEEIANRVPSDTSVIGISCMFTNNWPVDKAVIDYIGERFPKAVVIAGGESITSLPDYWIEQTRELDICVMGEGEETIVDLVHAIESGRPWNDVAGIVYRTAEGTAKTTRRTRVKQVEEIPAPAWEFFPLDNYEKFKLSWGVTERKSLPLMATRGCPYSCTFCSSPLMWGTRYYMRSPQHVADEMEQLINNYGVTNFDFYDLTAIIKRDWIIEFSKEIMKRKLDVTWQIPAGTRSEAIDAEVAFHLYNSGCRNITYAPESGSPRLLHLIKKKVKLDNMLKSMRYSRNENMHVFINIIVALPDETHWDMWQTIWFLIKCSWVGVNDIGLGVFQPYTGTALFDRLHSEGKVHLANDEFFLDQIFATTYGRANYYNSNIGRRWYLFYEFFTVFVFYASNYLFRPVRFIKTMRNLFTGNYESRAERALGSLIKSKLTKLWGGKQEMEIQISLAE